MYHTCKQRAIPQIDKCALTFTQLTRTCIHFVFFIFYYNLQLTLHKYKILP